MKAPIGTWVLHGCLMVADSPEHEDHRRRWASRMNCSLNGCVGLADLVRPDLETDQVLGPKVWVIGTSVASRP